MTSTPTSSGPNPSTTPGSAAVSGAGDKSLGELVATASRDLSTLIHSEIALAKAEIKRDVVRAGLGAGLLGGAGFTGVLALIFLSIALAYGISWLGIGLGWGFFIVGLLYAVAAGVAALMGKKSLTKVSPPERTIATVKDDIAWAKHPTRAPEPTSTGASRP